MSRFAWTFRTAIPIRKLDLVSDAVGGRRSAHQVSFHRQDKGEIVAIFGVRCTGDERCIELVAPGKLMDRLQVDGGNEVEVAMSTASQDASQQRAHAPQRPLSRSWEAR